MNSEIILIDKPAGITSFGVVARVRRQLSNLAGHKVKVGHTGTLDPFATGLLILLSGKSTKLSNDFLKLDKCYEATIRLGFSSTTGDPEGEITKSEDKVIPTLDQIKSILPQFTGEISQTVPIFSAVKINGKRAYQLARDGENPAMPTRQVQIYSLEILRYNYPDLEISCHVSSGTYIRTLGADIGEALGTKAYLVALRRTKVGSYDINSATRLEDF